MCARVYVALHIDSRVQSVLCFKPMPGKPAPLPVAGTTFWRRAKECSREQSALVSGAGCWRVCCRFHSNRFTYTSLKSEDARLVRC